MLLEKNFRYWVRQNWQAWSERIEPGIGSSFGIPDLVLGCAGAFRFVELKRALKLSNGVLHCDEVRAGQHAWQRAFERVTGVKTGFLIGWAGTSKLKPDRVYYANRTVMAAHASDLCIPLGEMEELSTEQDQFNADLIRVLFI